jgi:anhydro-N-acetylmuramic acid kinase
MSSELFIGAMSGTSLDGVDAVLARIGSTGLPQTLGFVHQDFPDSLRERVLGLCQGQHVTLAEVGAVDLLVAQQYVRAVNELLLQTGTAAADVRAIGAHGQTVHHEPRGELRFTLQLGDPNTLAVGTGIAVVADFRRRDMALGGQGAPLAPGFHELALRHATRSRVVLNCGGIANISVLVPGQPCIGYDTGPANILMDAWIQAQRGLRFDADGAWAATGQVHAGLLNALLAEPYFAQAAPKSTGRELFNLAWLHAQLKALHGPGLSDADVQRTLLELTARSVAEAVRQHAPAGELLVCGGGACNRLLMQRLAALMPSWHVASTAEFGIAPDAMEALAFAVFAQRTVHGLPGNLPAVTGASRPCVLGAVYLP